MIRSRAAPVVIALLSIAALGVAATTLEASLETDPDDEIDPDWERLPIGEDDAADVQREILNEAGEQDDSAGGDESAADETKPDSGDGDRESNPPDADGDGSETGAADAEADGERDAAESRSDAGGSGGGSESETGTGETVPDRSLLDRLLALLSELLPVLLALAALLVAALLARRYGSRLLAVFGRDRPPEASRRTEPNADWPEASPGNAVDRAWVALVERANPDRPDTATAAEVRELARERGLDGDAADAIATAFERVHYGGAAVADEEPRARGGLDRLASGPRIGADGGTATGSRPEERGTDGRRDAEASDG